MTTVCLHALPYDPSMWDGYLSLDEPERFRTVLEEFLEETR